MKLSPDFQSDTSIDYPVKDSHNPTRRNISVFSRPELEELHTGNNQEQEFEKKTEKFLCDLSKYGILGVSAVGVALTAKHMYDSFMRA